MIRSILFTDEVHFPREGVNNTRNSHLWDGDNPLGTIESNYQHHFSVNMWCGVICDQLISFFLDSPQWAKTSSFTRFLDHTRRTTVDRTPLDESSDRRRHLYLTTHNSHKIQISLPPAGFEPTISAGERPQTYALERAATGTGDQLIGSHNFPRRLTGDIYANSLQDELPALLENVPLHTRRQMYH